MIHERPLAPSEAVFVPYGTQGVVRYGVHGAVHTPLMREAVRLLAEAHPILKGRIDPSGDSWVFRVDEAGTPPQLHTETDFASAIAAFPIGDPLLRVSLLRHGPNHHELVVAVHHSICDAVSLLWIQRDLWRIYTALATGAGWTGSPADPLPVPVETRFLHQPTEAEVEEYLAMQSELPQSVELAAITPLAAAGDGPGTHLSRIELTAEQTELLDWVAREADITPSGLLYGVLLTAVRSLVDPPHGPATLVCVSTVDIRARVDPPLPRGTLVLAASGAPGVLQIEPGASPVAVGKEVAGQLRDAVSSGLADRALIAMPQTWDLLRTKSVSLLVSNLTRRAAPPPVPPGVRLTGPYIFAQPHGPFPVVVLSRADRALGIDIALAKEWFTPAQAERLTAAVNDNLLAVVRGQQSAQLASEVTR